MSSILMEFGTPAGADKLTQCVNVHADDDTTDHGSSHSDNEVSSTSESGLPSEGSKPTTAAAAPSISAADARRNELQKAGLEVLGHMSLCMAPNGGRGKKGRTQRGKQQQANAASFLKLGVQRQQPGKQQKAAPAALQTPLMPGLLAAPEQPVIETSSTNKIKKPMVPGPLPKAPSPVTDSAEVPAKVENLSSFGYAMFPAAGCQDPELPVKMRTLLFDSDSPPGTLVSSFNPSNPLKKRVPACLLQDPEPVLKIDEQTW